MLLVREEIVFPRTSIWIRKISRKMCFFTWLAARGVILIAEKLRKRKITCVSWCFMCKESREDMVHLLLNCWVAASIWGKLLRLFGIEWVMPRTMKEILFSWAHRSRRRRCRACEVAPLSLLWTIWRERNRRAFDRIEKIFVHLRNSLFSLVSFWCTREIIFCIDHWVTSVENHVFV